MSYTNTTSHYSLPQYVASDIPSILTDVNNAYQAIDTAIYNIAASSGTEAAAITALQTRMSNAEGNITTAQDDIDTAETNISANASAITSLQTRMTSAEGKVTALETQAGSETLTTTAQTLSGAVNELNTGISNIKRTLLWTNPSPSSSFSSETVTLSNDDYDILEIQCYLSNETQQLISFTGDAGNTLLLSGSYPDADGVLAYRRTATYVSDTSYTISECLTTTSSTNTRSSNNNAFIPVKIYGYKFN